MFQLIEKDNQRQAIHSKGDLEYMLRRGWMTVKPVAMAPVTEAIELQVKRKPGRPKKG